MSNLPNDFAVFILSHGRADNVVTYRALKKNGYTGPIYIIVDDEDKKRSRYIDVFGDQVIVFPKSEAAKITDAGDNFQKRNSVLYARNWCPTIARQLGIKWFWELDDDYSYFGYTTDNEDTFLTSDIQTQKLDEWLAALIEFAETSKADCVAIAQGGDFIGGAESTAARAIGEGRFLRKVMNSFLFHVDRAMPFLGRMNDDVNMYTYWGRTGKLFITVPRLRLQQKPTQENVGGLTEMYLEMGTYVKSFYTVMYAPSCSKVVEIGPVNYRIHHQISWKHAVPQILDPSLRK